MFDSVISFFTRETIKGNRILAGEQPMQDNSQRINVCHGTHIYCAANLLGSHAIGGAQSFPGGGEVAGTLQRSHQTKVEQVQFAMLVDNDVPGLRSRCNLPSRWTAATI